MTSNLLEVIVEADVVQQRNEYELARDILLKLIEKRNELTVLEIYFLNNWFEETGNYSEDVAVMIETWLQENDYLISDEFTYYRSLMEETPASGR